MPETSQELLLQNAFEFAAIGTALVRLDGRLLRVNASLTHLLGYSAAELRDVTLESLSHPEDRDLDLPSIEQLLAGEIPNFQVEKRYLHKSGEIIWALLHVSLIRDEQGRPEVFIAQLKDITKRKHAAQV